MITYKHINVSCRTDVMATWRQVPISGSQCHSLNETLYTDYCILIGLGTTASEQVRRWSIETTRLSPETP